MSRVQDFFLSHCNTESEYQLLFVRIVGVATVSIVKAPAQQSSRVFCTDATINDLQQLSHNGRAAVDTYRLAHNKQTQTHSNTHMQIPRYYRSPVDRSFQHRPILKQSPRSHRGDGNTHLSIVIDTHMFDTTGGH